MPNQSVKLHLKSVSYLGENVGNDLQFDIQAFGATYQKKIELSADYEHLFDPPEIVAIGDYNPSLKTLRRKIAIKVTEFDSRPSTHDFGDGEQFHMVSMPPPSGQVLLPPQEILVVEQGSRDRDGLTARFVFQFSLVFSGPESSLKLPILRASVSAMRTPSATSSWTTYFAHLLHIFYTNGR